MQDGSTVVKGTFAWAEPSFCPASGSYDAEWVFTPEDDSRYAAVSGTSAITVNAPAGKTYNVGGTVLEYGITGSSEQPLEACYLYAIKSASLVVKIVIPSATTGEISTPSSRVTKLIIRPV